MRMPKRDLNLLLLLIGLIMFLGSYLMIANRYNAKTEELQAEIASLYPRLEELRQHRANQPDYQVGINESGANIEAELARYPKDVRSEDLLMYAIELRDNVGHDIESISFIPTQLVSRFEIVRKDDNGEAVFDTVAAMKTVFSNRCRMNYEQLKRFINYLYETEQCTALERLEVVYDAETGLLKVSADISKYFLSKKDYEYIPTQVPELSQGTSNPFKTFTVIDRTENTDPDNTQN